ncbi:uncharacterized protein BT62DRAFT_921344 [Guyanagaster necrorhizus]|uniref:Uncharacterized protein n=1 Tax=Guyanagaster necrorhizus TaxID=856835 RepID=A0A9P8AQN8_9AGAR|nr:uncharacterized protein BT62DRAFT_921344 [Guyanagaster necrorhizus MCA 3950]KAG7444051.1 hypothetical protein BT62DRAFT_921344 [Guyanagaster necrorhizus MCA 3950]
MAFFKDYLSLVDIANLRQPVAVSLPAPYCHDYWMHTPSRQFSTLASRATFGRESRQGLPILRLSACVHSAGKPLLQPRNVPFADKCPIFVNGGQIGTGRSPQNGAVIYTAGLNPEGQNVFAIGVNNTTCWATMALMYAEYPYPEPIEKAVELVMSRHLPVPIVSDSSWKTLKAVAPGGWTSPSFDDSAWTAADVEGPSKPRPGELRHWLQTNESVSSGSPPRGHRPFRKTFTSPYGKAAVCGTVVLSMEGSYTLYVNGKPIGTGSDWTAMQAYSILQLDPGVSVVAVDGENLRDDIAYNDGTSETYYIYGSWKTLNALPPAGFERPDADDIPLFGRDYMVMSTGEDGYKTIVPFVIAMLRTKEFAGSALYNTKV